MSTFRPVHTWLSRGYGQLATSNCYGIYFVCSQKDYFSILCGSPQHRFRNPGIGSFRLTHGFPGVTGYQQCRIKQRFSKYPYCSTFIAFSTARSRTVHRKIELNFRTPAHSFGSTHTHIHIYICIHIYIITYLHVCVCACVMVERMRPFIHVIRESIVIIRFI